MQLHHSPIDEGSKLMQAHHDDPLRDAWLRFADAMDVLFADAARARVRGLATAAHASVVVEEDALARLLRYPARGARRKRPILIVASLINRYYVLDLLPE